MNFWNRTEPGKKLFDAANLELHKLEYWFQRVGAKQLGWDEGEARSHNFALRLLDDATDADSNKSADEKEDDKAFLRSEVMGKPGVVEKAEQFFSAARSYVLSRYFVNRPGHYTPLEKHEAELRRAQQALEQALEHTTDELLEAKQLLRRNMNAAMQIALSDTPPTVEAAGGNLDGYVYRGDPPRPSRWSRKGREIARYRREMEESFRSPEPDMASVKAMMRWPQLPEDITVDAVECAVVLREQLLELMLDRFNRKAGAGADEAIETLVARALPAALHKGGMEAGAAYELARAHEATIAEAIQKESQARQRNRSSRQH